MANRNFASAGKLYSMHVMPVLLDVNFVVGSSGAVGTTKGPGIQSITRLAAGIYQIRLQDSYNRYFGGFAGLVSPAIGSNVTAGSFVVGTPYVITALGSTDFNAVGVPADITPAVGMSFVATAIGSGSGTAKAVGASGIQSIEVIGNTNLTLTNNATQNSNGAVILVQCLGATSSSDTTMIAKDPAAGSVLSLAMYLSNSSVTVQGE